MNDIITIENTEMRVREYDGQMVVTFKDIDEVHERPSGTARNAFRRNKKHFVEGTDYLTLSSKGISNVHETYISNISIPARGITVLTESGYLMIVKAFNDDLSWKVQRELVNNYFKATDRKEKVIEPLPEGFPPDYPKPIYNTSSTPVPKNPNWYARNKRKIFHICETANVPVSALYHQILVRLGEEYDLDAANKIYCEEVGHAPKYALDIVSYFPELARMATAFIDKLEEKMNTQ